MIKESFAKMVIRQTIEAKLPEWIGTLAALSINWINMAGPQDIERVCSEMAPQDAATFRRMCAAVKGTP